MFGTNWIEQQTVAAFISEHSKASVCGFEMDGRLLLPSHCHFMIPICNANSTIRLESLEFRILIGKSVLMACSTIHNKYNKIWIWHNAMFIILFPLLPQSKYMQIPFCLLMQNHNLIVWFARWTELATSILFDEIFGSFLRLLGIKVALELFAQKSPLILTL